MKQLPRVYDVFFLPRVRLDVSSSSVRSGGPLAQLGKTHQRHTSLHPRFDKSLQQTFNLSTQTNATSGNHQKKSYLHKKSQSS